MRPCFGVRGRGGEGGGRRGEERRGEERRGEDVRRVTIIHSLPRFNDLASKETSAHLGTRASDNFLQRLDDVRGGWVANHIPKGIAFGAFGDPQDREF